MNMSVTIIVKAPNQQIEDQTVKCELTWTINKLKQHLSEVYPSKPPKEEQKLIYSGQLLSDTVVLGDVLRQYDGQETYTVHLVCATKQTILKRSLALNNPAEASTSSLSRDGAEEHASNVRWPNDVPRMDPNQYLLQMAWMQHAYMQYMTQYMNLNSNYVRSERGGQVEAQELHQPVARQRPRDPENADRDWLDLFYILTRVVVLFSVVYFYSSPLRFVFVVFLGFGFYLYQIGFFRNLNNNNNNHNNNNVREGEQNRQADDPSVLTIVWTFFATFFASLIPEVPQAV